MTGSPGEGDTPGRLRHVRWETPQTLEDPILIAAFEGWNDAGDAASTAVRFLAEALGAERFADIDPEEFFDFTQSRPHLANDSEGVRQVEWPENGFYVASPEGLGRDVVVLVGTEPQLKWRTFCRQVITVADVLGVTRIVTLGALIAEVPHSRPVTVFGTSFDEELRTQHDLIAPRYEGPTGIVGVLQDQCREAGIPTSSSWCAVPSYVPAAPSPKAALTLVIHIAEMLGLNIDTAELELATSSYEGQIDDLVSGDSETLEYVSQLEVRHDSEGSDFIAGRSIADDLEDFLREQ